MKSFLSFALFKLLFWLSRMASAATSLCMGFSLHSGPVADKRRARADFDRCVHRSRVLLRGRMTEVANAGKHSFLLAHVGYESPKALLDDAVTLIGFTPRQAVFVKTPEGLDVYSSEHNPFMYMTQFERAEEVLCMSLEHFMRFARELVPQRPAANVILLSNTGRCGSTLLTQMMEAVPNVVTMSEPDGLTTSYPGDALKAFPKWARDAPEKLTAAAVLVQCKPFQGRQVDHIIIKPRSACVRQTAGIGRELPFVRHVFMYRGPEKNTRSYAAMMGSMPAWVFQLVLLRLFVELIMGMLDEDSEYFQVQEQAKRDLLAGFDRHKMCSHMWALHVRSFLDAREKLRREPGVDVLPVSYEDLLADPATVMAGLLAHCRMPGDNMAGCLEAMRHDSQKNSMLSKDKLRAAKRDFSQEQLDMLSQIMQSYGLPKRENYKDCFKN